MKIRLRPHHAVNVVKGELDAHDREYLKRVHSSLFAERLSDFIKKLHNDTLVEIVEGPDDVCELGCPLLRLCQNATDDEYRRVMNARLRAGGYQEDTGSYEDLDKIILRESQVRVGQVYHLGRLKLVLGNRNDFMRFVSTL